MIIILLLIYEFKGYIFESHIFDLCGFDLFLGILLFPLVLGVLLELYYTYCWFVKKYIHNQPCKEYTMEMRSFMSVDRLDNDTGMNTTGCLIVSILLHLIFWIFTMISIPIDVVYYLLHLKPNAKEPFYRGW